MSWFTVGHIWLWLAAALLVGLVAGWWFGRSPQTGSTRGVGPSAALGVAALLVLALGGFLGQRSTASALTPQVKAVLSDSGTTLGAAPGQDLVSGREVTLAANSAPKSWTDVVTARKRIAGISGVRSVSLSSDGRIDLRAPHLTLKAHKGGVTLDGVVPDVATASAVAKAAAATFGTVRGRLTPLPGVRSTAASRHIATALPALKQLSDPELALDGNDVDVSGSAKGRAALTRVRKQFDADLAGASSDFSRVKATDAASLSPAEQAVVAASSVYFANASAVLDDTAMTTLNKVAPILLAHPGVTATLVGEAGPNNPNASGLSLARAASVQIYLVSRGVPGSQLSTKAAQAKAEAGFTTNDSRYRRVDITIEEN